MCSCIPCLDQMSWGLRTSYYVAHVTTFDGVPVKDRVILVCCRDVIVNEREEGFTDVGLDVLS